MAKSSIAWTEITWNPVTGCTKVSQGCKHCYAERMAKRLQAMGIEAYKNGFDLTVHHGRVDLPSSIKKPSVIFVNSMSDTFHERLPSDFILTLFDIMAMNQKHIFQVLTKRSARLNAMSYKIPWTNNIWMGVTVEDHSQYERIDHLRRTGAKVKFLSIEPMLSHMKSLDLDGIDWVIVGGESGPHCRPMELDWARDVRDKCCASGVPFFMKQLGGSPNKGENLFDIPEDLRIREWPGFKNQLFV